MPASRTRRGATLLYAIKQLELAVRSDLDEVLKPVGITTIQYTALTVLERREDLTSAALARRSFVTAQTMGDIVIALERRGFIERHQDPTHGRRLTIVLTEQGHQLLDTIRADVQHIEDRMTEGLSQRDRESLQEVLHTCLSNLTGEADHLSDHPAQRGAGTRQNRLIIT